MNLTNVFTALVMLAWATGNGALIFALVGVFFGLDGYTVGTRIMLSLLILFIASVGNLYALHFIYGE